MNFPYDLSSSLSYSPFESHSIQLVSPSPLSIYTSGGHGSLAHGFFGTPIQSSVALLVGNMNTPQCPDLFFFYIEEEFPEEGPIENFKPFC